MNALLFVLVFRFFYPVFVAMSCPAPFPLFRFHSYCRPFWLCSKCRPAGRFPPSRLVLPFLSPLFFLSFRISRLVFSLAQHDRVFRGQGVNSRQFQSFFRPLISFLVFHCLSCFVCVLFFFSIFAAHTQITSQPVGSTALAICCPTGRVTHHSCSIPLLRWHAAISCLAFPILCFLSSVFTPLVFLLVDYEQPGRNQTHQPLLAREGDGAVSLL